MIRDLATTRRRLASTLERVLLGTLMAGAAYLLERAVLRRTKS
jgi:hypothetical protein